MANPKFPPEFQAKMEETLRLVEELFKGRNEPNPYSAQLFAAKSHQVTTWIDECARTGQTDGWQGMELLLDEMAHEVKELRATQRLFFERIALDTVALRRRVESAANKKIASLGQAKAMLSLLAEVDTRLGEKSTKDWEVTELFWKLRSIEEFLNNLVKDADKNHALRRAAFIFRG